MVPEYWWDCWEIEEDSVAIQREFGEDAKNNFWSLTGFESVLCHFTALRPWLRYLSYLCFYSVICKKGVNTYLKGTF